MGIPSAFESVHLKFTFSKDINECLVANGGCMQECTNLVGSYNCSCSSGFYLDEVDLHNCTGLSEIWIGVKLLMCTFYSDVDECLEGSHICEQICLNHAGHYKCACEVGCDLQSDGSSCVGK